jgi:hypothetical protein
VAVIHLFESIHIYDGNAKREFGVNLALDLVFRPEAAPQSSKRIARSNLFCLFKFPLTTRYFRLKLFDRSFAFRIHIVNGRLQFHCTFLERHTDLCQIFQVCNLLL